MRQYPNNVAAFFVIAIFDTHLLLAVSLNSYDALSLNLLIFRWKHLALIMLGCNAL